MRLLFTFTAALLLGASTMSAQEELTNKNGHAILPSSGDYCLSMDGAPLIDFGLNVINIMNNTSQTAQHPGFTIPNTIVGKYFVEDTLAYRIALSINTESSSTFDYFDDPNDNSAEPAELSNKTTSASCDVVISAGLEYRRGYNRLQGFYGAEALLGLSNSRMNYSYGMDALDDLTWNGSSRVIRSSQGATIGLGARGFVGAEYFIAPKISFGAEFGWGLGIEMSGRGSTTLQVRENDTIGEETNQNANSVSGFGLNVDSGTSQLMGGSALLKMNLHF